MKRYCDGSIRLTWPQTLRPSTKYAFHGWNNLSARPNINNNRQLNHPSSWMGPSSWLGPSPLVKPLVIILEEAASVWRLFQCTASSSVECSPAYLAMRRTASKALAEYLARIWPKKQGAGIGRSLGGVLRGLPCGPVGFCPDRDIIAAELPVRAIGGRSLAICRTGAARDHATLCNSIYFLRWAMFPYLPHRANKAYRRSMQKTGYFKGFLNLPEHTLPPHALTAS